MFQDNILTECWPPLQARGREGEAGVRGVEALAPAARAAALATPAPREAEPPLEGRRPPRVEAAGCADEDAPGAGGTWGTALLFSHR